MRNLNIIFIYLLMGLFILPFLSNAQTNRNAVIGRYIVTSKRLDGLLNTTKVCNVPGKLDLFTADNYCNECILANDSTDCNGALGASWSYYQICSPVKVFADSSILDTAGFDPAYFATGKLYPNDSIYFRFKFCTTSDHEELMGFKLYSTSTKLNELSLPENALLISPNPVSGIMYIQSTLQTFIKEDPILYDLKGTKVNAIVKYVNSHTYKVDVSNLPNGVYFVFVQSNMGYLKKQIVVNR